jgi:hypothetical protein
MTKKRFFVGTLAVVLVFGVVLAGCSRSGFRTKSYGNGVAITGYTGSDKDIVIPATIDGKKVTHILEKAFQEKGLTGVTIPDSVTEIGDMAFLGNILTSITIPDSVKVIRGEAFCYNKLTSVTIGANVLLGDSSFGNGFDAFYDDNGMKAGTYTYNGEQWSYQQ